MDRVIVADWRQTRAALQTARQERRAVFLCSPEGAASWLGAGFWKALPDKAEAEFSDVPFTLALDCADRAGDALAALRAGVRTVIFTGPAETAAKLRDIAGQAGATILTDCQNPP
jgi:fructose/tagatose bisphosphate aldolase